MKKLLIMIPAYNEEATLESLLYNIPNHLDGIDQIQTLVINDGSRDQTSIIAQKKANIVINHQQNFGLGVAFRSGLNYALNNQADYLVNIDGDGQFNPNDIKKLITPLLNDEADCVLGSRFLNNKQAPRLMPKIKLVGNKILSNMISYFIGKKIYDVSCGFRSYNAHAFLNLNTFDNFTYTQESILDLSHKKIRLLEIPVDAKYFPKRRSRIANNLFKYAYRALHVMLKMFVDHQPFKFFGSLGLIIFSIGLVFDAYTIYHFIHFGTFTPYKYIGLLGGFFNIFGFLIIIFGFLADMIKKIRINQETLLYYEKRKIYLQSKL